MINEVKYTQQGKLEFRYPKPTPRLHKRKKYCSWCWEKGTKTTVLTGRQFLCPRHYKQYRQEKEKNRKEWERAVKNKILGVRLYERTKAVGTEDFSAKMKRKTDKTPDFDRELDIVQNEFVRIFKRRTIGDRASRQTGEAGKYEERKHLEKDLVYTEDYEGYIQYEASDGDGYRKDQWRPDRDHVMDDDGNWYKVSESIETKKKKLKDVYKAWMKGYEK